MRKLPSGSGRKPVNILGVVLAGLVLGLSGCGGQDSGLSAETTSGGVRYLTYEVTDETGSPEATIAGSFVVEDQCLAFAQANDAGTVGVVLPAGSTVEADEAGQGSVELSDGRAYPLGEAISEGELGGGYSEAATSGAEEESEECPYDTYFFVS